MAIQHNGGEGFVLEKFGGVGTLIIAGAGLNLATLEGDGRVIIQSMTYEGMIQALTKHFGNANKNERSGLGGLLGGGSNT